MSESPPRSRHRGVPTGLLYDLRAEERGRERQQVRSPYVKHTEWRHRLLCDLRPPFSFGRRGEKEEAREIERAKERGACSRNS